MKDYEMGVGIIPKKALNTQVTCFKGFSNKIQFVGTFSHPNNSYPMKKYIKLNSIMPFWSLQKCHDDHKNGGRWCTYVQAKWVGLMIIKVDFCNNFYKFWQSLSDTFGKTSPPYNRMSSFGWPLPPLCLHECNLFMVPSPM